MPKFNYTYFKLDRCGGGVCSEVEIKREVERGCPVTSRGGMFCECAVKWRRHVCELEGVYEVEGACFVSVQ